MYNRHPYININEYGVLYESNNNKKQLILKATTLVIFTLMIGIFSTSLGVQHYYKVDFSTGLVTATTLNVRSGPRTQYSIVTTVKKNEYIRVFAGVGD